MFTESDVIFKYTRQQAIEDGVLIDLSELAREAGFKFPLAITAGVMSVLNNLEVPGQDFEGRAWDMLTILKLEIRRAEGDTVYFAPLFASKAGNGRIVTRPVKMYAKCGPGDDLSPVITVMLEGED
jgi:hypothetical protein